MSVKARHAWRFSLRLKLLLALIPVIVISMFLAMAGLGKFLQDFFQRRAELEAAQLGQAIKSALRQSMLRKPELVLSDTLADVGKTPNVRRVWVIDKHGRVAHATDRGSIGQVLDNQQDPRCSACHAGRAVPATRTFFTQDPSGTPVLRHVRVIENEEACWGCHDAKVRLNGILLLEQSTQPFRDAMWTIQRRLSGTGIFTLGIMTILVVVVTTAFIERPIRRLMTGVRQLGTGDLAVRIPVCGRDELAELAGSINQMAGDLGRSLDEIQSKNAELSVVYTILERLTKTINLGELKEIILQTLVEVLGADRVVLVSNLTPLREQEILMRTRGVDRLRRISNFEDAGEALPERFLSKVKTRWLQRELGEPFVTPDKQIAVLPIGIRDSKLGLLLVQRERPFKYAEANQQLLTALAEHIGVAFENARLYTLAITDELTQLFTLRYFQSQIEEDISRYKRYQRKFGLLMLDVDHFKKINDTRGHPFGDEVLRRISGVLRRSIRAVDSAYRYGGEEFAILLPEIDLSSARTVAERVRQGIADLEIAIEGEEKIVVTASIGVATCPDDGTSAQQLVEAADAALYKAKCAGRNRVLSTEARGSDLHT